MGIQSLSAKLKSFARISKPKTMERGVAHMNKKNRNAKSLCAVLLSGALMLFTSANCFANETTPISEPTASAVLAATEITASTPEITVEPTEAITEATTETPQILTVPSSLMALSGESYVYNVTITFGSFDFYYDYGTWDSQNIKYTANAASKNPAAGTTDTFPGWYGFDGTTNKISIENMSIEKNVLITLQYTDTQLIGDTTDSATFPLQEGAVTMSCFTDAELTQPASGSFTNGCSFIVEGTPESLPATSKELYVSFSGKPLNKDGSDFKSAQSQRIGYITFTVSLPPSE